MGPLIARSGCSPRRLGVYLYEQDLGPIQDCISCLPTVRDLRITWLGASEDDFTNLFDILAEDPPVLPGLASLSIDDCQTDIDVGPLVEMLAARRAGRDGAAQLQSFRLAFDDQDRYEGGADLQKQDKDIELSLERLRGLRSEGLKVDIRSAAKWFSKNISSQMINEIEAGNHS
ncbi:hypothetical protein DFH07DRAFT_1068680 [Mycena maculata]|uniref:Uncharacterized protein n=1 Tax=Mycena maculata TaxID=230809 RepID=A0AAD7H5U9_9AGAR|nr:hypothetical protein DFH07DRAFT_1068680 [Mycena maculata]